MLEIHVKLNYFSWRFLPDLAVQPEKAPKWKIIYPSSSAPQRSWNSRRVVLGRLENSARKHSKVVVAVLFNGLEYLQMP